MLMRYMSAKNHDKNIREEKRKEKKINEDRWVKEIKVIACYFNLFGKGQEKGLYILHKTILLKRIGVQ
jgi:hypothetical protein